MAVIWRIASKVHLQFKFKYLIQGEGEELVAVFENPPIIRKCKSLYGEISLGGGREFYPQWNL